MTNSTPLTLKLPSEDAASNQETVELKLCKTKTKAAREKARREKMNERFACLAELINAEEPRVDKASILADTIRRFKSLKEENDQLKQINKFLEEKVTLYEKERNLALYQHSLMLSSKPPPPPAQFPFPQEGLFLTNQAFDFENQTTVMGTPLETIEERQDSSNGDQDLNDSPWMTTIEASGFHQDDFLHPPAA